MKDLWETVFLAPLSGLIRQSGAFLPHFLAMIVILVVGVLSAWGIRVVVFRLLKTIKFDQMCGRMGFSETLSMSGVTEGPAQWVSRIMFWSILLIFLMFGLQALNLSPVDQFVSQVFAYLPHLLVAMVILIVGFLLGNFFGRATLIAAVNARITQARFLSRAVRLIVIIFSLAMAFEQMGIAKTVIVAAFSITLGGVVLALAIAFGLGARDAARRFIEERLNRKREEEKESLKHV